MTLKRLTLTELQNRCIEIFYEYMPKENEDFNTDGSSKFSPCLKDYPTPMDMLWKETQDSIEENRARIELFEECIEENKDDKDVVQTLREQIKPLLEERKHFLNSCMSYQKELYAKTKVTDYSRNFITIPLDKKINSYYDDLCLEVVFYDDIGVNKGKYNDYKLLRTEEERREFIKANTEVTHLGLSIPNKQGSSTMATVVFMGEPNYDSERVSESNIVILGSDFADFNNLTLADTMKIQNNDLRQLFQSKIDLDKEDMKLLADLNIRGDNYKLLKAKQHLKNSDEPELFIRYVCPSTQRIYYNKINKTNLRYSDYYKESNYDSYLKAWWSITHMGLEVEGENFIRC